ncbi:MAG: hypothetical protein LBT01_05105 [Spirochaetaceae bacterium]|jgi:hypothetical protein|nr:hypothetical protein [Spirochaetaceae bacterium]
MNKETQEAIEAIVEPIAGSLLASMVVGAAASIITSLIVTDVDEKDLSGKKELHPTHDKTSVSSVEAGATETNGKVAQDSVSGTNGEIKASETEARALTGEATAAESGASALRTKAGASDIETKALKLT